MESLLWAFWRTFNVTIRDLESTMKVPVSTVHGSQHGAHLGPAGPRWAPCWPREPCYLGHIYHVFRQLHVNNSNPGGNSRCCHCKSTRLCVIGVWAFSLQYMLPPIPSHRVNPAGIPLILPHKMTHKRPQYVWLTYCCLVTLYGNIDLAKLWLS